MTELGGDYFIRTLQEFIRTNERKILDLSFEKSELQARVSQLEAIVEAKDRILKEYLKRVALLEYTVRKAEGVLRPQATTSSSEPSPEKAVKRELSTKEMIKAFLDELDMPSSETPTSPVPEEVGEWEPIGALRSSLIGASRAVAFSSNRRGFAAAGDDGVVRIWSEDIEKVVSTGERQIDVKNISSSQNSFTPHLCLRNSGHPLTSMSVSGDLIVAGDSVGGVTVWRVCAPVEDHLRNKVELFPSNFEMDQFVRLDRYIDKMHNGNPVSCVVIVPAPIEGIVSAGRDGSIVLTSGNDYSVSPSLILRSESGYATTLGLLGDSGFVAGMTDGYLKIFNADKLVGDYRYGDSSITSLCSVDDIICFAQKDGTIGLVDSRNGGSLVQQTRLTSETVPSCLAASAPRIAVGGLDGAVAIYDIRKMNTTVSVLWQDAHMHCRGEGTTALAFSEDGRILTSAGADGKIKVFKNIML